MNSLSHSVDITFQNLYENYIKDMEGRLKPTTLVTKRAIYETKLCPVFGGYKINKIDTILIRNWQSKILNYRDENGKPYSQTYMKSLHIQLSCLFNYAVRHYGLARNPCHLAGSIGKHLPEEMSFWTQDQFNQFILHEKKPAMKLAFDILFYTGMRCGELLALTSEDILPNKRIRINKNFQVIEGEEMIMIPKTSKSNRTISIPDFLYDEIMEYVSALYGYEPTDRIFYFQRPTLDREIHRVADLAGLPHITVHDLRDSHASLLIHMGVDIKAISERLGHKSVKTTWDHYAHLYPDMDEVLADKLQALQAPPDPEPEE